MIPLLTMITSGLMPSAVQVNENLTIRPLAPIEAGQGWKLCPLVPMEAEQGWKLDLFELSEPTPAHYHKIQRQIILVVEGELWAFRGSEEPVLLHPGELVCLDPEIVHLLNPEGTAQFLTLDLPGFTFPEDVYYDMPVVTKKWTFPTTEFQPALDPKYFGPRIDKGTFAVYDLVVGSHTEGKWSAALIEIQNVPRHFHRQEKEIFMVVNGELDVEIDGTHHILAEGESVIVHPGNVHELKSAGNKPVRLLCFNFPAFDPADMFYVK